MPISSSLIRRGLSFRPPRCREWGLRALVRGSGLLAALLAGVGAAPARAAADGEETAPKPVVPIERLFELPRSFEPKPAETRAGEGETAWRRRFSEARVELEQSQSRLKASKRELAELAQDSNAWTVAPPVGAAAPTTDAPLSYELRQRIRRHEAQVDAARERLLNLEVEANLAGVPEGWRN